MKLKFLALFVLCLAQAEAVINGEPCKEEQFPASLVLIEQHGSKHSPVCGATLIAPDVALTAAHCVENSFNQKNTDASPEIQFYVSSKADLSKLSTDEFDPNTRKTIRVHAVLVHVGYLKAPKHFQDDVALLFLSRKSGLPPARLLHPSESADLKPGLRSYIVGWGQQCIGANGQCHVPHVKMCATSFINQLTETEVQLGSTASSARTCFGDSGGAAYVQFEPTLMGAAPPLRLAGITSHTATHDPECRKGGIDARVDAYFEWITHTMHDGCTKGYRLFCG